MSKADLPRSVIDKWLHFDRAYTHKQVYMLLGIPPKQYRYVMNEPWNYLTVKQMEKIAYLVDKPLLDIFFACSKRPYKDIAHDIEKLRVAAALERSGIT